MLLAVRGGCAVPRWRFGCLHQRSIHVIADASFEEATRTTAKDGSTLRLLPSLANFELVCRNLLFYPPSLFFFLFKMAPILTLGSVSWLYYQFESEG